MSLTIETRAKRRAARVNKRLVRDVPLLVATGAVESYTVEDAAGDIDRHDASVIANFERMAKHDVRTERSAAWMRAFVAGIVGAEALALFDDRRSELPAVPAYACGFWGNILRGLDQELATSCGYAPVPEGLPITKGGGKWLMRMYPEYRERLERICALHDEAKRRRDGGVQMDLLGDAL